MASVGNKTEQSVFIFGFLIMALPSFVGFLYYGLYQTYVIIYDLILNAIGILILAIEFIFALLVLINIKTYEKSV